MDGGVILKELRYQSISLISSGSIADGHRDNPSFGSFTSRALGLLNMMLAVRAMVKRENGFVL
jgi:hypothetical protein